MTSNNLFYTATRFKRGFGVHVHQYVGRDIEGMLSERDIAGIKYAAEAQAEHIMKERGPRKGWTDYLAEAMANQTSDEA